MTRPIKHRGQVVAMAGARRVIFAPNIKQLPHDHGLRRGVANVCLTARDHDAGRYRR